MSATERAVGPSLVVFADTIHTVDLERPTAEAIAVDGGTIVAVGTRDDASQWDLDDAQVLDLGDVTVVPGFVDAHTHPLKGAERRWGTVDLAGTTTLAEINERIRSVADTKGPDSWVTGHSLRFEPFAGTEIRASHFEAAFGGRPGYLLFSDAHSMVANARALELGGITGERDFGNNARIVVDEDGDPTGYLIEDPMTIVSACVPRLSFEEKKEAVRATLEHFAKAGYTGVHQLNIENGDIEVLRSLESEGELPVRIRISPLWRATDEWASTYRQYVALKGERGRRWIVEGIKLMLDGTVDHGSAWLREPATDGSGTLPLWMPPSRYTETLHALAAQGIPTATHAIGDRAVEFVLESIASIPASAPSVVHRIEHVETITDELVNQFVELGVAASIQPTHMLPLRPDQSDSWSQKLGAGTERVRNAWRIKDLVDSGVTVALGSDWPVVESDPRAILVANMLRRPLHGGTGPVGPSQCMTAADSLRAFTQQVWASVGKPEHGVIRPGAVADFTVFRGDPLVATPEELVSLPVIMTIVDGAVSYRAPDVTVTHVFAAAPGGGNPAPIVLDATGMTDADMQAVAREHGHESGFVLPAGDNSDCDFTFRFWVPNHEMSMCGHITVGAAWLLNQTGRLTGDTVRIDTRSGVVRARIDDGRVEITQPDGIVEPVDMEAIPELLDVLGITGGELADRPIRNARTSRTKTLIPVADIATLDRMQPDFSRVQQICERIDSTGLYPYAVSDPARRVFDARQFPRSSGYPEDAATGIAAAALVYGLLADGLVERDANPIRVRQGRAMGRPSEIVLRFADDGGLWLGGEVR